MRIVPFTDARTKAKGEYKRERVSNGVRTRAHAAQLHDDKSAYTGAHKAQHGQAAKVRTFGDAGW